MQTPIHIQLAFASMYCSQVIKVMTAMGAEVEDSVLPY